MREREKARDKDALERVGETKREREEWREREKLVDRDAGLRTVRQ